MSRYLEMKTSELTGKALDWAVAYALNATQLLNDAFPDLRLGSSITDEVNRGYVKPTSDWSQCGEVIDREGIEFNWLSDAVIEAYSYTMSENRARGCNHREAACRLVAMELGQTVMVPTSLIK